MYDVIMYSKRAWFATLIIFFIGITFTLHFVFPLKFYKDTAGVLGVKTYTSPTSYSSKPSSPDFRQNEGAVINRDRATAIIFSNTTDMDAYLSVGITPMADPIQLCSRYQISPIYELWLKSQSNDAKILNPHRTSLISLKYSADDLLTSSGEYFPMDSLKMVYSSDGGYSWTTLRSSVVDAQNNTVSAISKIAGGYMIIAGYTSPDSYCNYKQI